MSGPPLGLPARVAAALAGAGLLFAWGSALVHWHHLADEAVSGADRLVYTAMLVLVSVGCIAVVLWLGYQDETLRDRDRWRYGLDERLADLNRQIAYLTALTERTHSKQGREGEGI